MTHAPPPAHAPGQARLDFTPVEHTREVEHIARPSRSYWQDAWARLRANRQAVASLWVIAFLLAFTLLGPLVWRVDPAAVDVEQISQPPSLAHSARVVADVGPDAAAAVPLPEQQARQATSAGVAAQHLPAPARLSTRGERTTQGVRSVWAPVPGAAGYRVYRTPFAPANHNQLGVPLAEVYGESTTTFDDRMDVRPLRYHYSVVAIDGEQREATRYRTLEVEVARVITQAEARAKGIAAPVGGQVDLAAHPLGTDYLGRDILARLMHGARVSLFIGIVAPLLYVLLGVLYGAVAGFVGGAVDGWLMRFADFMVALPFLLLMILMRVAFGIQGGESGILPMLLALVALSWPSTARLVRGQILQIREEGYIQAARLLGAPTGYLVLRHMIPNTLGVILVTLTFAVPSAIFTEAFLSFIGMGVAPPTPSWGSMCNEGRKTMLTTPHELIAPAALISLTVLAFNLLGDGMRDALDARLRSRDGR